MIEDKVNVGHKKRVALNLIVVNRQVQVDA
jgi:hypothetical protein